MKELIITLAAMLFITWLLTPDNPGGDSVEPVEPVIDDNITPEEHGMRMRMLDGYLWEDWPCP